MKNKILFSIILIVVLFNSMFLVYGFSDKNVKNVLKKSLFEYFDKGKDTTLTLDQTKDLLVFYLNTSHGVEDVNLDKIGEKSDLKIKEIISKALIGFEKDDTPDQNTCTVGYKCQTEFLKAYQNRGCSWSNAIFCEYGCANGECIQDTRTCTDSDGGSNYYEKGTAQEGDSRSLDVCFKVESGESTQVPYCTGPQCFLSEQYCSSEGRSTIRYLCPNGCQDGACI